MIVHSGIAHKQNASERIEKTYAWFFPHLFTSRSSFIRAINNYLSTFFFHYFNHCWGFHIKPKTISFIRRIYQMFSNYEFSFVRLLLLSSLILWWSVEDRTWKQIFWTMFFFFFSFIIYWHLIHSFFFLIVGLFCLCFYYISCCIG